MRSESFTDQAVAYLKASPVDAPSLVYRLSILDEPVIRPAFAGLHVCYLVDRGQCFEYVQNRHLQAEGISADQLHQIGLSNLRRLAIKRRWRVEPHSQIFAFVMGGDFEATAMLVNEFWNNEFRQFVSGKYAAAVPARDVMVFCDAGHPEAVTQLQQVIGRIWPNGDHLISNKVYVRKHDNWEVRRNT